MHRINVFSFLLLAAIVAITPAAQSEVGVSSDKILLGSSQPMTGETKANSDEFRDGYNAAFSAINKEGGVFGRKIEIKEYDDAYDARKSAENVKKLIDGDKVFAIFGLFGSKSATAVLPEIERNHIPFIGPTSSAEFLREFRKDVVIFRATSSDEAEALSSYVVDKLKAKNIAVIFQDDAFGKSGVAAIQKALFKRNMKLKEQAPYNIKHPDEIEAAMEKIEKSGADAIFIWSDINAGPRVLNYVDKKKWKVPLLAPSVMVSEAFLKQAGGLADTHGVLMASVYPLDPTHELIKSYYHDLKAIGRPPGGSQGVQGYFSALMMIAALKDAGQNPTRSSLIQAFEKMTGRTVLGLPVKLSPTDHQSMREVFLTRVKNGKWAAGE